MPTHLKIIRIGGDKVTGVIGCLFAFGRVVLHLIVGAFSPGGAKKPQQRIVKYLVINTAEPSCVTLSGHDRVGRIGVGRRRRNDPPRVERGGYSGKLLKMIGSL
jgi:hypothetical protein